MRSSEITVIIPTYNRAATLTRAVDSVLCQTIGPVRVLIVDDASTDGTQALLQVLAAAHENITVLRQETNSGACAARNRGILEASTPYIAFLDSDDAWYPDKLRRQAAFLEDREADIVFCSVMRMERGKSTLYPPEQHTGDLHAALLRGNFISTGMIFGKRECFLEGFDPRLPRLQDWDLMLRLTRRYRVCHQHTPLAAYYIQPDSISMDHGKLREAGAILFEKYGPEFSADPAALSHICTLRAMAELMTGGGGTGRYSAAALGARFTPGAMVLWTASRLGLEPALRWAQKKRLGRRCGL